MLRKLFFFSVSRLQNWKRVDRSLEIFRKVHEAIPGSVFIIGGEGEKKKDWEDYSVKLGIQDAVVFLGALNKDEVYYTMSISKYFISSYELSNMSNPLFEAMKNNCVVVTLDNGETGQFILDNHNGIISNEDCYLDNADKVIRVINSDELYDNLLKNSLVALNKNFSSWPERMLVEYNAVYRIFGEKLLKSSFPPRRR